MNRVNGRGLRAPVVTTGFTGEGITFRVDDDAQPEFWLCLNVPIWDLVELVAQWQRWNETNGSADAGPDGSKGVAS